MIGKVVYHLWFKPYGQLKQCILEGGPLQQWHTAQAQKAMQRAALNTQILEPPTEKAPNLYFLTGKRFWHQTLFAIISWQRANGQTPQVHLYDDGTLTAEILDRFARVVPGMHFQSIESTRELLDHHLPDSKFPYLRERWEHYPNIRKLTDVHIGQSGWKLVLDSDLLFFRQPVHLLDWLSNPDQPLHALDCEESYGYPRSLMQELCGHSIPAKLNVGLCGLKSDELDWEQIEYWTRTLIQKHGTHYYLEQALVAMIMAKNECCIAPEKEYITGPAQSEAVECLAIMHHYVSDTKKWYLRENWKKFI